MTGPAQRPASTSDAAKRARWRAEVMGVSEPTDTDPSRGGLSVLAEAALSLQAAGAALTAERARADAAEARLTAVETLTDEWQRELDSGAIRNEDARYCWSLAAKEVCAALAGEA